MPGHPRAKSSRHPLNRTASCDLLPIAAGPLLAHQLRASFADLVAHLYPHGYTRRIARLERPRDPQLQPHHVFRHRARLQTHGVTTPSTETTVMGMDG